MGHFDQGGSRGLVLQPAVFCEKDFPLPRVFAKQLLFCENAMKKVLMSSLTPRVSSFRTVEILRPDRDERASFPFKRVFLLFRPPSGKEHARGGGRDCPPYFTFSRDAFLSPRPRLCFAHRVKRNCTRLRGLLLKSARLYTATL